MQLSSIPGVALTSTAPANVTTAAASAGTAVEASRQDHKHDVSTAAPAADIGPATTNAEGTGLTTLARSNHSHKVAIPTAHVEQTTNPTTNLLTDSRMGAVAGVGGMILTPGAGTYLALFNSSVSNSASGASTILSLYVNGVPGADTVTTYQNPNNNNSISHPVGLHDIITVGAGQNVELMWRVTAGTATARPGSLTLVRLS